MGQRLVISFFKTHEDAKPLAAVYLHWSAYSSTAMWELADVMDDLAAFKENAPKAEQTDAAWRREIVNHYQNRTYKGLWYGGIVHGGISADESHDYMKRHFPDFSLVSFDHINRNEGLVYLTDHDMESIIKYAEGTAEVYLDTMTADNDCWFCLGSKKDVKFEKNDDGLYDVIDENGENVTTVHAEDKGDIPVTKTQEMSLAYLHAWLKKDKIRTYELVENERGELLMAIC